uniref:C-type lectin domain-containing protein n=1 Tax=Heliothis virescens TaxID=7102 RepID=A0A2A4K927_HELVI
MNSACKQGRYYKLTQILLCTISLFSLLLPTQLVKATLKMFKWVVYLTLLYITDFVVCKPDYLYHEEVAGWLKLHIVPTTWQDAFMQCHYEGAVLASPINSDFQSAISNVMREGHLSGPSGIFIGTNALFSEGDYISVEGVPLADMPVTWDSRYDGKPEKCLYLYGETVRPVECTSYAPYICYKERDNSTTFNECGTFDNEYQFSQETGSCYKFHSEIITWSEAHRICLAEGGYLAIINDQSEANIMKNMLPQQGSAAFIGMRKWKNDIWLTIHGEKVENVFHEWSNGYHENCNELYLQSDGTFRCASFKQFSQFICEKDPNAYRFQMVSDHEE